MLVSVVLAVVAGILEQHSHPVVGCILVDRIAVHIPGCIAVHSLDSVRILVGHILVDHSLAAGRTAGSLRSHLVDSRTADIAVVGMIARQV